MNRREFPQHDTGYLNSTTNKTVNNGILEILL